MKKELEEEQDPEWLIELCQVHSDKVSAANAKNRSVHEEPSTSSRGNGAESRPATSETRPLRCPDMEQGVEPEILFELLYTVGGILGKGSFGYVYEGVRKEDRKQVALKIVNKLYRNSFIPGQRCDVPVEVELMKKVSEHPCCSNVVELLEWFDMTDQIVLVMERPSSCININDYARLHGRLTEAQVRGIMLQVVQAAHHCCSRGVMHRDIKAQNLLINTATMQVKLIDFGCGALIKDTPFKEYAGTPALWPPEWVRHSEYHGAPATVWGLGILTYYLLFGDYPLDLEEDLDDGYLELYISVSRECYDLMMWCLELEPEFRPSFEDILRHEWFTEGARDKDQVLPGATKVVKP